MVVCLVGLAACSRIPVGKPWDQAFFTDPPARPFLPASAKGPMVSVCYSRFTTTVADLRHMIAKACVDPRYIETDYIGDCTYTAPARVTFSCRRVNSSAMTIKHPYRSF
jgi:hypothetical protein